MLLTYLATGWSMLSLHIVRRARVYLALLVLVMGVPFVLLILPPPGFETGTQLVVSPDTPLRETAETLHEHHLIYSPLVLRMFARLTGSDAALQAGRYAFPVPEGAAIVLYRLTHGVTEVPSVRVTFPEGQTVREMADTLTVALPDFNTKAFIDDATPYEGYLFPDTYLLPSDATPEELVARMRSRFDDVWRDVEADGGTTLAEGKERVVIMASLLEKETKANEDRRIVSGILWHRIALGMPLQVDAVFGYINGVDTYHPSGTDLTVASPYNTYEHQDLPPGAIGNPGRDALVAALTPSPSPYLYYLFGSDGAMHYAETFEEHKKNKEWYLR